MDSAAEDPRSADRDDEDDLISGLHDDVLLHILELVADDDATDAARMGTLSRRWRELWARVPALRFAYRPASASSSSTTTTTATAALERYVSFVDGVLARRSSIVQSLAISYAVTAGSEHLEQLMPALVRAAQGWIRYAVSPHHHGRLKRFNLDLDCRHDVANKKRNHDGLFKRNNHAGAGGERWRKELVVVLLDDDLLPTPPGRRRLLLLLETMRLALGGVRLRLPAAATGLFASLRDLSLERIRIVDDGGHLLARLVSSASCPCLQKLRLNKVRLSDDFKQGTTMRLEAGVLSELWMEEVHSVSLELTTPSLRVLHIANCFHKAIRISAPRLQQLAIFFRVPWSPICLEIIDVDDGDSPPPPTCVRRLKLRLWSHGCHDNRYGEAENNSNAILLHHYSSSITCFHATLSGPKVFQEDVDLIESSRIPHLPHTTSLTVNVAPSFERHDFGLGVANLLTRFSNLRHLTLHLPFFLSLHHDLKAGLGLECHHQDYWTSYEISMDHLQEVELSGLTGTDCELWLMKVVLASAKGLRKVAIGFNPKCWQHQGKLDAFKRMLLDEGMQTSHPDAFMLHAHA